MTLSLIIENSPHPQPVRQMRFQGGELSIGRAADCDWQIDDPDMFVSRRHCIIAGRDGRWTATDASRGGLYVDGKDTPLGAGNSVTLEHGTRLRMGDVVLRVEFEAEGQAAKPQAPARGAELAVDDFFAQPAQVEIRPPRPETLPEPFENPRAQGFTAPQNTDRPAPPPLFDDPFTLDPARPPSAARPNTPMPEAPAQRPANPAPAADFSFDDFFGAPAAEAKGSDPATGPGAAKPQAPVDFDFGPIAADPAPSVPAPPPVAEPVPVARPPVAEMPQQPAPPPQPPIPAAMPPAAPAAAFAAPLAATALPDDALRQAFYRGLRVEPPSSDDLLAEMEDLGRRFRQLSEGLILLLRTRAKEKGSARVAQTVIGHADVNPLKFLPTTDEAVSALAAARGKGYLDPDDAIEAAFRDLTDHHMRTWTALQTALRRMIDRFDPAAFEAEAAEAGALKALLPGGRSAKLWQYYTDRYREMASAAEERFLGDVGADFRDAYEGRPRTEEK